MLEKKEELVKPRDIVVTETLKPAISKMLECPLCMQIMMDPVITPAGHAYERE